MRSWWFGCTFLILLVFSAEEIIIPLSKIINYQTTSGLEFGSPQYRANGGMVVYFPGMEDGKVSLRRKMIVLRTEDLGLVDELVARKDCLGVILVVDMKEKLEDEKLEELRRIEEEVSRKHYTKPILFYVYDGNSGIVDPMLNVIEDLKEEMGSSQWWNPFTTQIYGKTTAKAIPKVIPSFYPQNLFGTFRSSSVGKKRKVIVVNCPYEAFSIIPSLTFGLSESGGAEILLMIELIKVFKVLYDSKGTRPAEHDILFLFSAGDRFSFEGGRNFISKYRENIEVVINLHQSLQNQDLFIVSSKKFESSNAELLGKFKATAEKMDFGLKFLVKKKKKRDWEHQLYQNKGIDSFTISGSSKSGVNDDNFIRSSIFDNEVNTTRIRRNVQFIAESIINYLFRESEHEARIGVEDFVEEEMGSMIDFLNEVGRSTPFMDDKSPFYQGLKMSLAKYIKLKGQKYESKSTVEFFENPQIILTVLRLRPLIFEVLVLVAVLLYLFGLLVFFKGFPKTIEYLKGFFASAKDETKEGKKDL